MAAPNLATIANITGKSAAYAVTDASGVALLNDAINDAVYKINSIRCTNLVGITDESITLTLSGGAADVHLASTIPVPANGVQVLTSAETYFYLKPGWSIKAQASAASSLELVIGYEVLSDA